jgi:hypothetical protein
VVVVEGKLIRQAQAKVVLVVVAMLTDQHKAVREDGLKVQAEGVVGITAVAAAVVVAPALLLSVIKTYIKRNNNFFLIV